MDRVGPASQSSVYLGPPVDARGLVIKRPLRIGAAEGLRAMGEYAFFTPAVPYLYGRFCDTFLIDWMCGLGRTVPLYYRRFDRPIFSGLRDRYGAVDWDHALWAVSSADWPEFLDFFCSLTVSVRDEGSVARYGQQVLDVADPLAADRAVLYRRDLPRLEVSAFGLDGNHARLAFRHDPADPAGLPTLGRHAPDGAMRAYAGAHLAGRNPFHAHERFTADREATYRETRGGP